MKHTPANEQAFPSKYDNNLDTGGPGMTMREWYAGMAMQGLLRAEHEHNEQGVAGFRDVALAAFHIADAMLQQAKEGT